MAQAVISGATASVQGVGYRSPRAQRGTPTFSGGSGMVCKGKETEIKTPSQFSSQNNSGLTGLEQLGTELKALRSALDGMVLTDMAGLSPNLQSTTKV